jgi:hypothetical protein
VGFERRQSHAIFGRSEADVEAISIIRCTGKCLNGGLADPNLLMEERPA